MNRVKKIEMSKKNKNRKRDGLKQAKIINLLCHLKQNRIRKIRICHFLINCYRIICDFMIEV